jgi:hypothetical protein
MSQLAAIASRFSVIRKAMLFGRADAPVKASSIERIYPECESYYNYLNRHLIYPIDPNMVLQFPHLRRFPLNAHVLRHIAACFSTNFPGPTFHTWSKFIPERTEQWGKLCIPDGGDCIQCAAVVDPLSPYGKQDLSFVRIGTFKLI